RQPVHARRPPGGRRAAPFLPVEIFAVNPSSTCARLDPRGAPLPIALPIRSAVMSKLRIVHGLLGLVLALCIPHGPARAQSFVTFVSGNGLDTNPCTRGQPCKTFSTALGVTLENGSIIVLDAADYGPVFIKKSVSIVNDNAGTPADVNAALATVAGT